MGCYLKCQRVAAVQIHSRLASGKGRVRVVARLVVVVLHVQVGQLGVLNPQGAAGVVDVLTVQRQLGRLGCDHVRILDQCLRTSFNQLLFPVPMLSSYLEGVVLGEGHNLHNFPNSGKDLEDDVQGDWIDHVLHNNPRNVLS